MSTKRARALFEAFRLQRQTRIGELKLTDGRTARTTFNFPSLVKTFPSPPKLDRGTRGSVTIVEQIKVVIGKGDENATERVSLTSH